MTGKMHKNIIHTLGYGVTILSTFLRSELVM
jgi:hypothetical protein